jgi:hypothetical protein
MFEEITVHTRDDAIPLVAALSARTDSGVDVVLAFDEGGVLVAGIPMEPNCPLPQVVALIAAVAAPGERLMLVSNRTGQYCADRPDDELVWEEMAGIARANNIVLLDWWVTWGTKAFSLAEFAPTPAAWSG